MFPTTNLDMNEWVEELLDQEGKKKPIFLSVRVETENKEQIPIAITIGLANEKAEFLSSVTVQMYTNNLLSISRVENLLTILFLENQ